MRISIAFLPSISHWRFYDCWGWYRSDDLISQEDEFVSNHDTMTSILGFNKKELDVATKNCGWCWVDTSADWIDSNILTENPGSSGISRSGSLPSIENQLAFSLHVAGPWNVEFAKKLHPDSVRARFGVSDMLNAVYCTDLQELEEVKRDTDFLFKAWIYVQIFI